MKYLFVGFVFASLTSTSQNCPILNKYTLINGLQLGMTLPKPLLTLCTGEGGEKYLDINNLDSKDLSKYSSLFNFQGQSFSQIAFSVSNNNKVYAITFWNDLDELDIADLENGYFPDKYIDFKKRIIDNFGNETKYEEDSSLSNIFGKTNKFIWKCSNVEINILMRSNKTVNVLNSISVEICDVKEKQRVKTYFDPEITAITDPDWIKIGEGEKDEYTIYMKSEYVKKDYNGIKIWVKTKYLTKTIKGKVYKNVEQKDLLIINCTENQVTLVQSVTYSSNGKVIISFINEDYEQIAKDVIPDSVGERIVQKVCEKYNN